MKKFSIFALAALLVVAMAVPASALENIFGGAWNIRMFNINDRDGSSLTNTDDDAYTTQRTRLYYTAKINDNLKLVNKFEIDYTWGSGDMGDIGAYGGNTAAENFGIEIKQTYADFNIGPVNAKVGTQGGALGRAGILFNDDFSGMTVTYKLSDSIAIPFVWIKAYELAGGANGEDQDADIYALAPVFKVGEGITIQPLLVSATSDNVAGLTFPTAVANTELDAWFYGVDVSAAFGPLSVYGFGVMQSGDYQTLGAASVDLAGWALNVGASYDMGMFSVRADFLMETGDDGTDATELSAFTALPGESMDKGELLMSNGMFWGTPTASPWTGGTPAGNTFAATSSGMVLWSLGATVKPMDKLKLTLDYYNAKYDETAAGAKDDIGSEIDFGIGYQLIEGLNLDVKYCFYSVGDAVVATNAEDQTLIGAQLSLSF